MYSTNKKLAFEQLSQAVSMLIEEVKELKLVFQEKNEDEHADRWSNLKELCEYLPGHPSIIIQVRLNDLVEANQLLIDNTRRDFEQLIADFHKKEKRKREEGKDPDYLTIDEATEFLPNHPTKSTLRTMCCRRQIPFCKMGGRLIFKKNELQKFIERSLCHG
jgi:hypothetical protein